MSQAWMIASGKGGVGKTAVTAALGAALSKTDLSCAVLDADMGLRNLDILLGLENYVVYDVLDVIRKDCKLKQALIQDRKNPSLALVPASQMGNPGDLKESSLGSVVKKLKKRFSYVLLDAPAGIGPSLTPILQSADHTLLVTTPDDIAIRDAERLISLLEENDKPRPMLIVNRVYPDLVRKGKMYSPRTVSNILDVPLLGYIPNDIEVIHAMNRHETFMETDCPASRAMRRICRRFMGEYVPMPELEKKRSFFDRFRKEEIAP